MKRNFTEKEDNKFCDPGAPKKICRKAADIDNASRFKIEYSEAYFSSTLYDVTFLVEGERLTALRSFLAMHSSVFRKMFFENMPQKFTLCRDEPIALKGRKYEAVNKFLQYFYTGCLNCSELDFDTLLEIFCLAQEYEVEHLIVSLADTFQEIIEMENVFRLQALALHFDEEDLLGACHDFICENADDLIVEQDEELLKLSKAAMLDLLSLDELPVEEFDLLEIVYDWAEEHPDENPQELLQKIRLKYISFKNCSAHNFSKYQKFFADNDVNMSEVQTFAARPHPKPKNKARIDNGTIVSPGVMLPMPFQAAKPVKNRSSLPKVSKEFSVILPKAYEVESLSFDIKLGGKCRYYVATSGNSKADSELELLFKTQWAKDAYHGLQFLEFEQRSVQKIVVGVVVQSDLGPCVPKKKIDNVLYDFQCPSMLDRAEVPTFNGKGVQLFQFATKTTETFPAK